MMDDEMETAESRVDKGGFSKLAGTVQIGATFQLDSRAGCVLSASQQAGLQATLCLTSGNIHEFIIYRLR